MNLYEFFAGGGMARIGLGPGWKCTFANDDNHDGAMKTPSYVANFGRGDLIVGDVARLTTSDLPGIADLAWASPPCQDFSVAGDRAGLDGERSSAVWPFLQLMQPFTPKAERSRSSRSRMSTTWRRPIAAPITMRSATLSARQATVRAPW
jgi:site-specific DNA-cytosine methylase